MGGGAGATAAAAAAAATANAIKASGSIVRVEPEDFLRIIRRQQEPLVVRAPGGLFGGSHQYLSSYKGLTFYTKSSEPLSLPGGCEVIQSQKIWIPG